MKRILIVNIWLILLFTSCEKEPLPDAQVGNPEFVSNVTFDGEPFEFIAGENQIIMDPSFQFVEDAIQFNSAYTIRSCEECGPELRVLIKSPEEFSASEINDWIEVMKNWDFPLSQEPTSTIPRLSIEANCGNESSEGIWLLDGEALNPGAPSNDINFAVEAGNYVLDFANEDETCLDNGPLDINFDGEDIPCYIYLSFDEEETNVVFGTLSPSFNLQSTSYVWAINGVEFPPTINSEFVNLIQEDFELCLTVTDTEGDCVATDCMQIQPSGGECTTNIAVSNTSLIASSAETFAFSEIQFRDSEGTLYTSNNPSQNEMYMELISIEPYSEPSMPEQPFAKMSFEVQTTLFDDLGDSFPFSGIIQMAAALPE